MILFINNFPIIIQLYIINIIKNIIYLLINIYNKYNEKIREDYRIKIKVYLINLYRNFAWDVLEISLLYIDEYNKKIKKKLDIINQFFINKNLNDDLYFIIKKYTQEDIEPTEIIFYRKLLKSKNKKSHDDSINTTPNDILKFHYHCYKTYF